MSVYKFNKVLNDLHDWFILGDPEYLLQYKNTNNLPDDLISVFTSTNVGDDAVEQGVIVPMIGVENYPYTIYFNLSDGTPELLRSGNKLQHRKDGYCLKVNNGQIYLYTVRYLFDYTIEQLKFLKNNKKETIRIKNGWYSVSILAGLTKKVLEDNNSKEEMLELTPFDLMIRPPGYDFIEGDLVPTFEFLIKPSVEKPEYKGETSYKFSIGL